jgi:hypothetical protein
LEDSVKPGLAQSVFLRECGQVQLLSLLWRPSVDCTPSTIDAALVACSLAALTIVTLAAVRVIAPSFTSLRSAKDS